MAYTVSNLSNYVDEQSDEYLYQTIAEGTTTSLIPNVQSGIKTSEKIKIINTEGVWQPYTDCGFTASGGTTFSDRTITVGGVKIQLDWCPKQLETKYTQLKLKKGSKYEELTFEKEIVGQMQNTDKNKVEMAVWNGDTTSGDEYLNKFDGFRKIIGAAAGVLTTSTSGGTTWSEANSRTVMRSFTTKVSDSLPHFMADPDTVLFMGVKEAADLKLKYITDNLYHITGDEGVLKVEGTEIPIVPVLGLSGKGEMYLMRKSNMYLGVDLESEEDKFEVYFAKEADKVRYDKRFKMGVQVAFPSEIIKYITA
jgi:hypothetical protein